MGISFACPLAAYNDLENGLESVTVKSISFGDNEVKTPMRSISFNDEDKEPTILKSIGSGKMMIEGSVHVKTRGTEMPFSTERPSLKEKSVCIIPVVTDRKERDNQSPKSDSMMKKTMQVPILGAGSPKHEAATKLQKVYKSFRTRRRLADCAVLIESWWNLLDFAELKRSSVSFFDIEKHETAISRWSRARTRAAKVGKGLSKNSRARKLARQHWLEAIDPRHRYGHNLHFYFVKWLQCQSDQPFFYWLDIGEGKEISLVEKCPRSKLQQQCIKYLGPMERKAYEVAIEDGKLFCKQTGEALDTTEPKGAKWIFVLSTSMILYVGKKKKGTFQHSSFLAGGVASAAGRLVVEKGILKAIWPHSGHYQPTPENFQDFISFLMENNVDLTDIKTDPVDGEDSCGKQNNAFLRSSTSEEDLTRKIDNEDWTSEKADSTEGTAAALESPKSGPSSILTINYSECFEILESENQIEFLSDGYHTSEEVDVKDLSTERINSAEDTNAAIGPPKSRLSSSLRRKLTDLTVPNRADSLKRFKGQKEADGYGIADESSASEECEQDDNVLKQLSDEKDSETKKETIPKECILQRINSRKELKSHQLGKQLSSKWTTGAGARIGCLRDYPSELQFHALEQVNLSPGSARCLRSNSP